MLRIVVVSEYMLSHYAVLLYSTAKFASRIFSAKGDAFEFLITVYPLSFFRICVLRNFMMIDIKCSLPRCVFPLCRILPRCRLFLLLYSICFLSLWSPLLLLRRSAPEFSRLPICEVTLRDVSLIESIVLGVACVEIMAVYGREENSTNLSV